MNNLAELYDLSKDIGEFNNLADEFSEKIREIEALMRTSRTSSALFPLAGE